MGRGMSKLLDVDRLVQGCSDDSFDDGLLIETVPGTER